MTVSDVTNVAKTDFAAGFVGLGTPQWIPVSQMEEPFSVDVGSLGYGLRYDSGRHIDGSVSSG